MIERRLLADPPTPAPDRNRGVMLPSRTPRWGRPLAPAPAPRPLLLREELLLHLIEILLMLFPALLLLRCAQ